MRTETLIVQRANNEPAFIGDSLTRLRALKIIAREYPELSNGRQLEIPSLEKIAIELMTDPAKLQTISDFSLTFGEELEADRTVTPIPYADYIQVSENKFLEKMDQEIEAFARTEGLRRDMFFPEEFTNITGWTTEIVLSLKNDATDIAADILEVPSTDLSFNAVEEFVNKNYDSFSVDIHDSLKIFRTIVLRTLSDNVVAALKLILQEILLTSGSHKYSNISLDLGNRLNLNNRTSLEIAVKAERLARKIADRALVDFRAIFPQLRRNIVPDKDLVKIITPDGRTL